VRILALLVALVTSLPVVHVSAQPQRRDLQADERCGGHTVERHVGRTNAQLAERLRQQPDISAASTYPDLSTAETVVGAALARERSRIAAWSARRGSRPNLALRYRAIGPKPIGRSWQRGKIAPDGCFQAVVVLRWDVSRNTYCVLTSYPEVGR
jgi:Bacterial CdiA-CT RNAse A domain